MIVLVALIATNVEARKSKELEYVSLETDYNNLVRDEKFIEYAKPEKQATEIEADQQRRLVANLVAADFLGASKNAEGTVEFKTHERFAIQVLAEISPSLSIDEVNIGIVIKRNDGIQCYGTSTVLDDVQLSHQQDQIYGVVYEIERLPLLSGRYVLDIWLIDSSASVHVYDSMLSSCSFSVRQESSEVGVVFLQHEWKSCV